MDWNELKYLLAVSRAGQAGRAADELSVSHATVSRKIAELEKKLGVNLVDRSGLSWTVTPIGQRIAKQVEMMENCVRETESIAKEHSDDSAGTVHISAPNILITELLAGALNGFSKQYPNINLAITSLDSFADLRAREADIALRFTDMPDANLVGVKIRRFTWSYYANGQVQNIIKLSLGSNPDALPKVPLLTSSPDDGFPSWARGIFHPESTLNHVYGYREKAFLAAEGLGVALLPDMIGLAVPGISVVTPYVSERSTQLWILSNDDAKTSSRIRTVKKFLINKLVENDGNAKD